MAMISYPVQASRRDDCILAIFPFKGGCILNKLNSSSTLYPTAGAADSGSWAIKNGLLSFQNAQIYPDGFGSIFAFEDCDEVWAGGDDNLVWIDTSLDLRGNTTSKTIISKIYCPAPDWHYSQQDGRCLQSCILSSGSVWSTYDDISIFRFLVETTFTNSIDNRTCTCIAGITFDDPDSEERIPEEISFIMPENWYHRFIVYALVVDYDTKPGYVKMSIYLDGERYAASDDLPARAWSTSTDYHSNTVRMRTEGNTAFSTYNIASWGMIFDSAFSEEEIKKFK